MNKYKDDIHIWVDDLSKSEVQNKKQILNVMAEYYGFGKIQIKHYKSGKPYLDGQNTKISISRCNGRVLYALSYCDEVGLDVEKVHALSDIENFSKYIFIDEHAKDIIGDTNNSQAKKFYSYWTLYEAYAKFTGQGLLRILQNKNSLEVGIENIFFHTFVVQSNCVGTVVCVKKKQIKFFQQSHS